MIRLFDIFFSITGFVILFPFLILIYLLGLIDSGSPLFLQKRVGCKLKIFTLIKFRTMPINTKNTGTHLNKNIRLNFFGRFLRKTKLDEIPQLINVLIGNMSIVGPRPGLVNQKKLIIERKKRNLFKYRPGITGLAQTSGIDMKTPLLLAKTDLKMMKQMNFVSQHH